MARILRIASHRIASHRIALNTPLRHRKNAASALPTSYRIPCGGQEMPSARDYCFTNQLKTTTK